MNGAVEMMMNKGMTKSEAQKEWEMLRTEIFSAVEDGDFDEAEDIALSSGFDDILDFLI